MHYTGAPPSGMGPTRWRQVALLFCASLLLQAPGAPGFEGFHPDLNFAHVGTEAGLPGDVVTAVHRDRQGFLWVGTRNGLARFDGYSCVVYDHSPSDPASLSDNVIRVIAEDSHGALWIGTNAGGLNRFDRVTGRFERFRHDPADATSISHDSVYVIIEAKDGSLWVGTQIGLNRLIPGTRTFERFLHDESRPGSLSNDYVLDLQVDRDGRVWIATFGGGLNAWHADTNAFEAFLPDSTDPGSLDDNRVLALATDKAGQLWVGTYAGVSVMEEWGRFRRLSQPADESRVADDVVVTALESDGDRLWASTLGAGVIEIDPGPRMVRRHAVVADVDQPRILALDLDDSGVLWVGTWGSGLLHARPYEARFANTTSQLPIVGFTGRPDVMGLIEDRKGRLWVSAMNAGLLRRERDDGPFQRDEEAPNGTLSLAEDRDGTIWIGATSGLIHLNPETGERQKFTHDPLVPASMGKGYVATVLVDREGRKWAGTGGSGLCLLREDGISFERFTNDPADPTSLSDPYVSRLLQDSRGILWVGTRSGGLNAFDPRTRRSVRFSPANGRLAHHYVTSLLEDRKGGLWVGTSGGGLHRAALVTSDVSDLRFEILTEADGLPDDDVAGLAEDSDGSIWVSTKRGIARLGSDGRTFVRFGLQDGLPTLDFNSGAILGTPRALYFGSPMGLVETPTGTPMARAEASPLAITAVRRQGASDVAAQLPLPDAGISLRYQEWLGLEWAVLDLSPERNHRHEYRLDGARGPWVDLGSRRELTFVDLSPGTHALELRGRNTHGAWTTLDAPITIRVLPPFWMTSWFRALAMAFTLLAIVTIHQTRTRALRRRNEELLTLHAERERALGDARSSEERLRVLAQRLESAKEEERKHLARELHDELGQSLTAVKVNLDLAQQRRVATDVPARLMDSTRIVDQLIQKVRSLSLDLRPPLMEEQGLVPALRSWLAEQSRRGGIDVGLAAGTPTERVRSAIEIASFRVVQEAVTNALRHARATQVRVTVSRDDGWLQLLVEDDGQGFDPAAMLERASRGLHVGILGMQERVQSLGGNIRFESAPGEGTTVRVRLPWEDAA